MTDFPNRIVLDASVIIELLAGNKTVESLGRHIIREDVETYVSRLNVVEALYVTCRLWGFEKAFRRMELFLGSQIPTVVELDEIWEDVAACKCHIPISIGDCATLSTAKKYKATPVFLTVEKEQEPHMEKIVKWAGARPLYIKQ